MLFDIKLNATEITFDELSAGDCFCYPEGLFSRTVFFKLFTDEAEENELNAVTICKGRISGRLVHIDRSSNVLYLPQATLLPLGRGESEDDKENVSQY